MACNGVVEISIGADGDPTHRTYRLVCEGTCDSGNCSVQNDISDYAYWSPDGPPDFTVVVARGHQWCTCTPASSRPSGGPCQTQLLVEHRMDPDGVISSTYRIVCVGDQCTKGRVCRARKIGEYFAAAPSGSTYTIERWQCRCVKEVKKAPRRRLRLVRERIVPPKRRPGTGPGPKRPGRRASRRPPRRG